MMLFLKKSVSFVFLVTLGLLGVVNPSQAVWTDTPTPDLSATPTFTSTPTPSATPVTTTFSDDFYYSDDIPASSPGDLPPGWYDSSVDGSSYVTFQYSGTDGLVNLTQLSSTYPAKALTEWKPVSLITGTSHYLQVQVDSVAPGSKVKIGVFKIISSISYSYYTWSTEITGPGLYGFDLNDTSWTNYYNFQIMIYIEGSGSLGSAVIDSVAITDFMPATMTPTLTGTPTITLTPTPTSTPSVTEIWTDDFQEGDPGTWPAKWQFHGYTTLRAAILRNSVTSYATVFKTYNPYDPASWGKVISQVVTVNTDDYPQIKVVIPYVAPNTGWKVGVENGSTFIPICASQNQPGTYVFDYTQATGWTGVRTFLIDLVIEGYAADNSHFVVDYVSLTRNSMQPTPTVTPTAPETSGWQDQFLGVAGNTVQGWYDNTSDPDYNASIQYSYTSSHGIVTRDADSTWGKVLSPAITLDTSLYNRLEINVAKVSPSVTWKVGIQEAEGSWNYYDLSSSTSQTGTFDFDFASITGFTGTKTFAVQVVVEGNPTEYIEMGHIRIYKPGTPFTPTISPTSTTSPTSTSTPTATPTSTPLPSDIFFDNFIGTAGVQPNAWGEYAAEIVYSPTYSLASITRTAADTWGKVLSPYINCNVDIYDTIEVNITEISANATFKIGIQQYDYPYQYWDLNSSTSQPGTYQFDITSVTGWSGTHAFQVQLTLEGAEGTWMTSDWVRVCQAGTVQGSSAASSFIGVLAPLPSATSTVTSTSTVTPVSTIESTATPTPSPSATATPYVTADKVVTFPNPARDRVSFAYTVKGQAQTTIDLYTLAGERVARISDQPSGDGVCVTTWDAANVAPGIYLARIMVKDAAGNTVLNQVKKVAVVK